MNNISVDTDKLSISNRLTQLEMELKAMTTRHQSQLRKTTPESGGNSSVVSIESVEPEPEPEPYTRTRTPKKHYARSYSFCEDKSSRSGQIQKSRECDGLSRRKSARTGKRSQSTRRSHSNEGRIDASTVNVDHGLLKRNNEGMSYQVEKELHILRREVQDLTKTKEDAIVLHEKYQDLHKCKQEFERELEALKVENIQLSQCLKEEVCLRTASMEEIRTSKKALEETIERIFTSENFRQQDLLKELMEKDARMREAVQTNEKLTQTTTEQAENVQRLQTRCNEIEHDMCVANQRILDLSKINAKLVRNTVKKQSTLENVKKKMEKFREEILTYKTEIHRSLAEIEKLRNLAERNEYETKMLEITSNENLQKMTDQLRSLQEMQDSTINQYEAEKQDLQTRYDGLMQKDNQRCQQLENQIRTLTSSNIAKEADNEDLRKIAEDLTVMLKNQKARFQELTELNKKQFSMLHEQEEIIASHDDQLAFSENERTKLSQQCQDLRDELERASAYKRTCTDLQQQLEDTKTTLSEERDKLLINSKIIEDQLSSIQDLKEQLESLRRNSNESFLREENQLLHKELQEICESKCKLETDIKHIDEVLEAGCVAQQELRNQRDIVAILEKRILIQQQESDMHLEICHKEKMQAMNTARFATEKLKQTMDEFEQQTQNHSHVRDVLTGMLRDNEKKLKQAVMKVNALEGELQTKGLNIGPEKLHNNHYQLDFQQHLRNLVPCDLFSDIESEALSTSGLRSSRLQNDFTESCGDESFYTTVTRVPMFKEFSSKIPVLIKQLSPAPSNRISDTSPARVAFRHRTDSVTLSSQYSSTSGPTLYGSTPNMITKTNGYTGYTGYTHSRTSDREQPRMTPASPKRSRSCSVRQTNTMRIDENSARQKSPKRTTEKRNTKFVPTADLLMRTAFQKRTDRSFSAQSPIRVRKCICGAKRCSCIKNESPQFD